jgi:rare lipoprotein A
MRKALYMFLILGFVTLGSAQSSPNKKGKAPVLKDTISIENPAAVQPEIIFNDTVIAVKGKFRLYKKSAHASYYADKFSGRKTASGKKFSNKKYTAAHRKLPFGTIVRVTNEANGQCVLVEITDRGPFSRGREIDLSKRAFMEIASNKNSGSMLVKIEVDN